MSGNTAARDARRLKAIELRLAGASFRQIGSQLGVSEKTAHDDVHHMLRATVSEASDEIRQRQVAQLRRLMLAHWQHAVNGDVNHTSIIVRLMEREAKLLGIDAPRVDYVAYVTRWAIEEGLDPSEAVRDAEELLRST